MVLYIALFITFLFIIFIFYEFFKPLKTIITGKLNIPSIAIPFQETIYFDLYHEKFKAVCEKAAIDYAKLNIHMLPISFFEGETINAFAVETLQDRNNIIITEKALERFINDPEMAEVAFAHELGHLNYMDSLLMIIKTEYIPVILPLVFALCAFFITYAIYIVLINLSPVICLFFIVIFIVLTLIITLITLISPIMSVWFAQLAEIRADLFAKRICGLDNTLRFMQLVQEYEEDWFNSLSIFERFKFVYNKKENTHPNLFFRVEQIRKLNVIGFNYKVAHYFRLLWWFITLRGFYGRNAILKEKNAVSMDI